ncbi:MAG: hypothetical protein V2A78_01765 [bacterium]
MESRGQLPIRVRSAVLKADSIQVSTSRGDFLIPRDSVVFVSFGIIDEEVGFAESRQSNIRKMIRSALFGEEQDVQASPKSFRHVHLMDIFVRGEEGSFRIDGSHFNYRSVLDEVGHSSADNFRNLMASLIRFFSNCYFTRSAQGFILRKQEEVKHYKGVYDFEIDSQQGRRRMDEQIPCERLRLDSRIQLCKEIVEVKDAGEESAGVEDKGGEQEDNNRGNS